MFETYWHDLCTKIHLLETGGALNLIRPSEQQKKSDPAEATGAILAQFCQFWTGSSEQDFSMLAAMLLHGAADFVSARSPPCLSYDSLQ